MPEYKHSFAPVPDDELIPAGTRCELKGYFAGCGLHWDTGTVVIVRKARHNWPALGENHCEAYDEDYPNLNICTPIRALVPLTEKPRRRRRRAVAVEEPVPRRRRRKRA